MAAQNAAISALPTRDDIARVTGLKPHVKVALYH